MNKERLRSSIDKTSGEVLFFRYGFSPNRLKYCGPDSNLEIFELASCNIVNEKLSESLRDFEGAFPYLEFIARSNKITNPFNYSVVEAYWLGNDLLKNVSLQTYYRHLKERFGKRLLPNQFGFFDQKLPSGAKPYHAFHVFDIYRLIGGIRKIDPTPALETIDNCRISWGRIVKIYDNTLEVEYRPIVYSTKLEFGPKIIRSIEFKARGRSFLTNPKIRDMVSFHWGWACDILTPRQLSNLQKWTLWHLNIANNKNTRP